jgi:hypothetical protein
VLQSWNKSDYFIENIKGNTYQISGDTSIQFTFSNLNNGVANVLTVFQNGEDRIWKRKKIVDSSNLNLEDYIGTYYSNELEVNYSIILEEEKLKVKFPNNDVQELHIYDVDTFTTDGGLVQFNRLKGKVTNFILDAGRVTNLKFEKKQ